MLIVSKEVYAASDIAKLGRPKAATANGRPHAGAAMPGDTPTVGTAPNGEPLYAAEWYREPTNRELAFYLPKRMPEGGGWGMVACRTAARFKVEDCVELASGPQGSGLGRAVRDASWQFLVRPPRVGGRVLVGEWVRIRIDYIRDEDSRR
jgi:protein TonB